MLAEVEADPDVGGVDEAGADDEDVLAGADEVGAVAVAVAVAWVST